MRSGSGLKRILTRRDSLKLVFSAICLRNGYSETNVPLFDLVKNIPPRPRGALTGSQFAESIAGIDGRVRERAILNQVLSGNLPDFLRRLMPIKLKQPGKRISATIFAMPEYLSIGSDNDFLRIPMNLYTATAIANQFRFLLPTRRMVDAIYNCSFDRFKPQPMPAGGQMRSTRYYRLHNALIEGQARSLEIPAGVLVAGHKKDVVLTNRLAYHPGQIAIYGWHRGPGDPIQPLSTVHGANYADYSHGIRLVSETAVVNGNEYSVSHILQDSSLADILSDEGSLALLFRSGIVN